VQMSRPDPFNHADGCGSGEMIVHPDGVADKIYALWNRNPITVTASSLKAPGKKGRPAPPNRPAY